MPRQLCLNIGFEVRFNTLGYCLFRLAEKLKQEGARRFRESLHADLNGHFELFFEKSV